MVFAVMVMCRAGFGQGLLSPEKPEDLSARAISRAAMLDLQMARSPGARDYRIASELLEIAHALSPKQAQILRMLVESQTGAGRSDRVLELNRELVGVDPGDTVAQLRLISGRISQLQTADKRLAAYERFLGAEAETLDASLRSRLSLDCAMLYRELGEMSRFADRLSLSLELDPTNKDAATLALTFFSERVSDPLGRLDLQLGVLYADPYDVTIHRAISRELAEAGAFKGADRFLRVLDRLYARLGMVPDAEEQTFREVVQWNLLGAETLVRRLTDSVEDQRKDLLRRRSLPNFKYLPADGMPRIDDIRLPLASERSRLLAASAAENREAAALSMSELAETARRLAESIADPAKRSPSVTEEEVTAQIQEILTEVVWLRLWSNQQIDEAATGLSVLAKDRNADRQVMARLSAWQAMRRGEFDAARAAFEELAGEDPFAELGLAVLDERAADRRSAVTRYLGLAQRFGGRLLGAYCRTRINILAGTDMPRSDAAREMEEAAASVPDWLESIIDSPARAVSLEVEAVTEDVRVMERTPLRIRLTNVSPLPMGVGATRPLNSRIMLVPSIEVQGVPMGGGEFIEIASLDRRLRLLPRESFETTVWGDAGNLGLLLDMSSSRISRVRWRVLQGFYFAPGQYYEPGPHSLATGTIVFTRRPNQRFLMDSAGLRTSLETGGPREIGEAILAIRARQARTVESAPLTSGEVESMMDVIASRYVSADKAVKTLVLALLPSPVVQPETRRVDAVAQNDADEDVLSLLLALRADEADSALFSLEQISTSERLSSLADDLRSRLRSGVQTIANSAQDVRTATPPLIGPPRPEAAPE